MVNRRDFRYGSSSSAQSNSDSEQGESTSSGSELDGCYEIESRERKLRERRRLNARFAVEQGGHTRQPTLNTSTSRTRSSRGRRQQRLVDLLRMRLKPGARRQQQINMPQEEQCLLKNQTLNRHYEENTLWTGTRSNARPTALSNTTRSVQQVWTGQQLFRSRTSPTSKPTINKTNLNNANNFVTTTNATNLTTNANNPKTPGRDSALASPLDDEELGDRAMSLSSPEESYPSVSNGASEEDSLSDLEYNESCPLLSQEDLSGEEEGCSSEEESNVNNVVIKKTSGSCRRKRFSQQQEEDCEDEEEELESEDSVFSDSSCDMSDPKERNIIENLTSFNNHHRKNNNINTTSPPPFTTVLTNHSANRNNNYFRGTSRVEKVFTETVQPLLQPVTSRPAAPVRVTLKTDVSEAARVLSSGTTGMTRNRGANAEITIVSTTPPPLSRDDLNDLKTKLPLDNIEKVSETDPDASSERDRDSPMSESSSSLSDVDINMASGLALNKVSMPVSKKNELQCFLQEETDNRSLNNVNVETDDPKILNTQETSLSLQEELRMAAAESTDDKPEDEDPFLLSLKGIDTVNANNCHLLEEQNMEETYPIEEETLPSYIDPETFQQIESGEEFTPDVENKPTLLLLAPQPDVTLDAIQSPEENIIADKTPLELEKNQINYEDTDNDEINALSETLATERYRDAIVNETVSNDVSEKSSAGTMNVTVKKAQNHEDTLLPDVTSVNTPKIENEENFNGENAEVFKINETTLSKTPPPQKQAVVKPYRFENEECLEIREENDQNQNPEKDEDGEAFKEIKEYKEEKKVADVRLPETEMKEIVAAKTTTTTSTTMTDCNVINNNQQQQHRKDISVQISANKETSDVALSPVAALNPKFPEESHLTPSSRRRSVKNKKNSASSSSHRVGFNNQKTLNGDFDVYNIETAMPTIDWAAMEEHLTRAAKENDWLRRNDREEIRRKLAMDSDSEEYYCGERVTRKPSLTTRLQSGMNLQICFMNETASDLDSQGSDQDSENGNHTPRRVSPADKRISSFMDSQKPQKNFFPDHVPSRQNGQTVPNYASKVIIRKESISSQSCMDIWRLTKFFLQPLFQDKCNGNGNSAPGRDKVEAAKIQQQEQNKRQRPSFFFSRQKSWRLGQLRSSQKKEENPPNKVEKKISPEEDFLTRHARLQAEARHALSQAKEMARMQMEVERQRKKKSPIADIVGIPFPDGRHRLSRQILTDMNVAQLQVIVNDLHSQIESLNEDLVRLLLERDDLNMEQDSMLVDIEDMTRFLGAKEEALKSRVVPKMGGLK